MYLQEGSCQHPDGQHFNFQYLQIFRAILFLLYNGCSFAAQLLKYLFPVAKEILKIVSHTGTESSAEPDYNLMCLLQCKQRSSADSLIHQLQWCHEWFHPLIS